MSVFVARCVEVHRELCRGALGGKGASLALGPCTQPGGACALQGPCLSPATPSHLLARLPLRPPSARSRASPGCQACTGVDMACWSFGVYEHRHFHDGMWVSQRQCVCVCLGVFGSHWTRLCVCDCVRFCACIYAPRPQIPERKTAPLVLVVALFLQCPSRSAGSWGLSGWLQEKRG